MTTRKYITSGSTFEAEIGYSRAVVDGDWIFVSGTTGFDYRTMTISESIEEQTEQCFRNILEALAQAGAGLRDVVRVRYILPDAREFERTWPVLRRYFGDVRPAATMMAAGLADPRMKIEIEVTAKRQRRDESARNRPITGDPNELVTLPIPGRIEHLEGRENELRFPS